MKRYFKSGILVAVLMVLAASWNHPSAAKENESEPSVQQIVERANQVAYYQGKDGRADVNMTIVDDQDRERIRKFTILRRDDAPTKDQADQDPNTWAGDQRFYIYFHAPPDVKDTVFMVWKHVAMDQDDDRWLYLPGLDLVKRIAASDERTSFVGSHFFYEDVSGRNINEDEHKLVDVTSTYFILENTPKEPERVEFSRYKMWIHKDTYLPVQTEYYDKRREAYRRYKVLNVSRPQGFLTVMKSRMEDLRSGGHTTIEYSRVEYDVGLPTDIFTERYLRKPPMKYIGK